MKVLKTVLLVLLTIVVIALVTALFVPKDFNCEKEIVINKPKQEVFDYIKYVKNQENFGVWYKMDTTMKKEYIGTDGTVGFRYKWDGEKMGEGEQVITKITEGQRMESDLFFNGSKDAAKSHFIVSEKSPTETLVKWGITGNMPYPMNLMNLFMDMSDDFEQGLKNLKSVMEK